MDDFSGGCFDLDGQMEAMWSQDPDTSSDDQGANNEVVE